VATYLSMHIIACMTRQALNQLITTMQAAEEVRLVRASASQMAGRLLCEFDAPDQNTLLRLLDTHHVAYEWIIRAELTWGEPLPASAPKAASESATPTSTEESPDLSAAAQSHPVTATLSDAGEFTILHILRALQDDGAWQIIRAQHEQQPVAVLLMHDAVLAPPALEVPMYACEADVIARGITSPLPRLTYDQIVDLIFACKRVMVW
jgi:sulfur transfer complex TusBCD TusB component (DsrH family)